MKTVNLLGRAEMKKIVGGNELPGGGSGQPLDPTSNNKDDESPPEQFYKCCWPPSFDNCSYCVLANVDWKCQPGAVFYAC